MYHDVHVGVRRQFDFIMWKHRIQLRSAVSAALPTEPSYCLPILFLYERILLGLVAYTLNPSTEKVEAGVSSSLSPALSTK